MDVSTDIEVLDRLKIAANASTDLELATKLGLSKQAIADAKSKKKVPSGWIPKAAVLFEVSTDWLYFGHGHMRTGELPRTYETPLNIEGMLTNFCAHCAKLERVEEERRELSAENRRLWKENGDLRERCATLTERMACSNSGQ